mmetsp:Transcript_26/g.84  ORF Transcript_26/g.84 Transcript_26/m.84 type:complete len:217 (+) Transcript_26:901-1551(+)
MPICTFRPAFNNIQRPHDDALPKHASGASVASVKIPPSASRHDESRHRTRESPPGSTRPAARPSRRRSCSTGVRGAMSTAAVVSVGGHHSGVVPRAHSRGRVRRTGPPRSTSVHHVSAVTVGGRRPRGAAPLRLAPTARRRHRAARAIRPRRSRSRDRDALRGTRRGRRPRATRRSPWRAAGGRRRGTGGPSRGRGRGSRARSSRRGARGTARRRS